MRLPSSTGNAPTGEVPRELRNAWLRFHEAKWCRGVDTVFVFGAEGMEVWCLVEDDKSYRRFSDMVSSLKGYDVELYTTFPTKEDKKKPKDPPPSLWNNLELRAFLRDPFLMGSIQRDTTLMTRDVIAGRRDFFLKQRMTLYAAETLEWMRSMRRYGSCLPSVTRVAFDPEGRPEVRERALAICEDHAREVEKYAGKIMDNLARALPKPPKRSGEAGTAKGGSPDPSAHGAADQVYVNTQNVAQSIYRFFYPRDHAVRLVDLKDPRILDSLKVLRKTTADYRLFSLKHPKD